MTEMSTPYGKVPAWKEMLDHAVKDYDRHATKVCNCRNWGVCTIIKRSTRARIEVLHDLVKLYSPNFELDKALVNRLNLLT